MDRELLQQASAEVVHLRAQLEECVARVIEETAYALFNRHVAACLGPYIACAGCGKAG